MEGGSVALATSMFQGRPYVFKVENEAKGEHLFINARSMAKMNEWVSEIKKAVQGKAMTVEEKEAEEEEHRRIQEEQIHLEEERRLEAERLLEEQRKAEEERRAEAERLLEEERRRKLVSQLMAMGARARFRAAMEAGETELMENAAAELLQSLWQGKKARLRVAALRVNEKR